MGNIAYDPIKDRFARIIRHSKILRRFFYFLLDLFFLRGWHIRRILRKECEVLETKGDWQLLDAGCGFGQYDRFVLNRFKRVGVTSIDVKESYLADCRKYFSEELQEGRIEFFERNLLEIDYEEQFDVVICIDVLEHIEEDVLVLSNLYKALKPGGIIVMHSPSHYSEKDSDEEISFVSEHARTGYSKDEISDKLKHVGFQPMKIHYTYGSFGYLAWVLSVKYPIKWIHSSNRIAVIFLLLYYPVVMPCCIVLNYLDLYTANKKGNGIYAVGGKKFNRTKA